MAMRSCVYVSQRPATSIRRSMKESGMQCRVVRPEEAKWALEADRPAVIIVEAGPLQIALVRECAASRARDAVLITVAEQRDKDLRISLLQAGADACLDQPLSVREVDALIEALTRRLKPLIQISSTTPPLGDGQDSLTILKSSRRATNQGQDIPLTAGEWELISLLADAIPISREEIRQRTRQDFVDGAISRLRRKLAGCAVRITFTRGVGYRLEGRFQVG